MLRISSAGASTVADGSVMTIAPRAAAECGRAGLARPARPERCRGCPGLRSLVDAAVRGGWTGLKGVGLHSCECGVERLLDLGAEHARLVVEVGGADSIVVGVEQHVRGRE